MTVRPHARNRALTIAAVAATSAAAAIGAHRLTTRHDLPPIPEEHTPAIVTDWRRYGGAETVAGEAPGVRVVVFSDYQCGYCARARTTIGELAREYRDAVRIEWRHFPHLGVESRNAAVAAECARRAGRFEETHERLFAEARARTLGLTPWTRIALESGVRDTVRFAACLEDATAVGAVDRDMDAGRNLSIRGTPAVLLDSLLFQGAPERRYLRAYVRRMVANRPARAGVNFDEVRSRRSSAGSDR